MNRLLTYTKQAAVEAAQDSWNGASSALNWLNTLSLQVKSLAILAFVTTYYGVFAALGLARSGGGRCTNEAGEGVVEAIGQIAQVIMFIVGALVVLMFMVGGALIVAGGKSSRVQQGFTFLKNALIGLAVVAAAFFIQEFVLKLVAAAVTGDTPGCLESGQSGASNLR